MLELRQAEGEIVRLLAPDEAEPPERAVGRLRRDRPEPSRCPAPAREGRPDGARASRAGSTPSRRARSSAMSSAASAVSDSQPRPARISCSSERGSEVVVPFPSMGTVYAGGRRSPRASGRGRAAGSSGGRAGARGRATTQVRASATGTGAGVGSGASSSAASSWQRRALDEHRAADGLDLARRPRACGAPTRAPAP